MIIAREEYTLIRINWEYVLSSNNNHAIEGQLYRVRNNSRKALDLYIPALDDSVTIDGITDNEIYELHIFENQGGKLETIDTIEIRDFTELKQDIIITMQDTICDCESLDSDDCITGSATVYQNNLNNLQLLYNSVLMYRNMLLSRSFSRPTEGAVINTFSSMSVNLLNGIMSAYDTVNGHGKPESTIRLLRKQTAIMYIIFYVIEYDIASFVDYPDPDDEPEDPPDMDILTQEQKDVNSWFGMDESGLSKSLAKCFDEIGIDYLKVYNTFHDDYVHCDIGIRDCGNPIDPPFEDNEVYDLSYDGWTSPIPAQTDISVTRFTWKVRGFPTNLKISDSVGQLQDVPVTGTAYTPPTALHYTSPANRKVIWTINSDNAGSDTLTTRWTNIVYWDKTTRRMPPLPNNSEILAGNQILHTAGNPVTFNPNVQAGSYCWCAVPLEDTPIFRIWATEKGGGGVEDTGPIEDLRHGGNSTQVFVCLSDTLVLNGITYYFYAQNISSTSIQTNLTLRY